MKESRLSPNAGESGRRWENGVTWLAGAVALLVLWPLWCTAPGIPWNAARLAPSFALVRGLPIYALRDSGAHLGWVYGPVFPLWYAPAGLTDNPTVGLLLASAWSMATLFAPLALVLRYVFPGTCRRNGFLMAIAALLLLANPITRAAFLFIHVDALSVAWAAAACVALHAGVVRGWRPGLPLAAFAVALAVAAKQVSVVLVPATLFWLWFQGHRGLIVRWLFWLAVVCGGLAAVFFVAFGAEGMLFNAWLLFSRMPWQGGWEIAGRNVCAVLAASWLWLLAAVLLLVLARMRGRTRRGGDRASLLALFVGLAAWQLPMGIAASMVVDAALNSIHSINYLFLAGLIAMGDLLEQPAAESSPPVWLTPRAAAVTVGLLAAVAAVWPLRREELSWTPYRGQEELVALARQHAGKIYLPWNPLTTIITERKIYPFDEALHYLWLSRLEPPHAAIVAAVPADPLIIYQEPSQTHFALRYFRKPAARE